MERSDSLQDIIISELLSKPPKNNCEQAFLSGVLRGASELVFTQKGFAINIFAGTEGLACICRDIIDRRYGGISTEEVVERKVGARKYMQYKLCISAENSALILRRTGIVANNFDFVLGIPDKLIERRIEKVAYLKGVYLSCATLTVPRFSVEEEINSVTKSSGYHLEFLLNSDLITSNFMSLISDICEFEEGTVRCRKNGSGVYIKSAGAISDCLAVMGCSRSVMALQDIIMKMSVKNNINRSNNFLFANMDKTLNASAKQIMPIKNLIESARFDTLDEKLRELAYLRVSNPDATLARLAELTVPPSGKSGINHRMRKLLEIANEEGNTDGK